MNDLIRWEKCEKEFVRKVEIDEEKIKSIVKMAMKRLERARNAKEVSFIIEDYYEVIKELLIAYLLKNGLRSRNHQCLISYFYKENPDFEKEACLISQMCLFRNRLCYYGEDVPAEFYKENKEEIEKLIKLLLSLI